MAFLKEYRDAVRVLRNGEAKGSVAPATSDEMMFWHGQNIRRICVAMHEEIKDTSKLIRCVCYDKDGHARQPDYDELLDLMSAHRKVYLNTMARIRAEAEEMNATFKKYTGRLLYRDTDPVEFADRMVAELGDLTTREEWAFREAALGNTGTADPEFVFEMVTRTLSKDAVTDIMHHMSVSGQQALKDEMSGRPAAVKERGAWGGKKKDPDLRTIFKLEELYHKVIMLNRGNQEQIVNRMRDDIGKILDAMRRENIAAGDFFLEMADATTRAETSEKEIAECIGRQLSLKAETDKAITDAVMDLQKGAMHVLHTDLLEGKTPVEWAEDLANDLKAYGRELERANDLAQERGMSAVLPSGFPFFEQMTEGCKALFKQIEQDKKVTLRDAVFGGAKKVQTHSLMVRTTKAMTGYKDMSVCILPVFDPQTHSMRSVPLKACYDKTSDTYVVGEAEYTKNVGKGIPAIPVVIESPEPSVEAVPSPNKWNTFSRDEGVLKQLFGYGPEMPRADRETVIRGVVENRRIGDIDALLTEQTDEVRDRQQHLHGRQLSGRGLGDAVKAITGAKDQRSYLAWYFNSQRNKETFRQDCDFFRKVVAESGQVEKVQAGIVYTGR